MQIVSWNSGSGNTTPHCPSSWWSLHNSSLGVMLSSSQEYSPVSPLVLKDILIRTDVCMSFSWLFACLHVSPFPLSIPWLEGFSKLFSFLYFFFLHCGWNPYKLRRYLPLNYTPNSPGLVFSLHISPTGTDTFFHSAHFFVSARSSLRCYLSTSLYQGLSHSHNPVLTDPIVSCLLGVLVLVHIQNWSHLFSPESVLLLVSWSQQGASPSVIQMF